MLQPRQAPQVGAMQFRAAQIEKAAGTPRTIRFIASDETVDRYGDIIRASGWNLANFDVNPVLLFAHNSRAPSIGTAKAWVDGTQLLADATFHAEGISAFADEIWRITDAGGLRAVSVGFLPTEEPNLILSAPDQNGSQMVTGFEFIAQDLLEISVVPVPANPAALALARSLASETTIRRLFPDDTRAAAQVAAEHRRRSITLARLRGAH